MKRSTQTVLLIVCGYLGMWLLVCFLISSMIYGTTANTPDWVFWAGLALAIPLYIILCGPKEVIDIVDGDNIYEQLYRDKRDEATKYRLEAMKYRVENISLKESLETKSDQNRTLEEKLAKADKELEEAKACRCRKVTMCVRGCGK